MDGVGVWGGDVSVVACSADLDFLCVDSFSGHVVWSVAVGSFVVFGGSSNSSSFPGITYRGNGRNFVRSVSGRELSSWWGCWCVFGFVVRLVGVLVL